MSTRHKKSFLPGLFSVVFVFHLTTALLAQDLSLQEIIDKLQANQSKIQDMYAETTTKITSNIQLPTDNKKQPQTMVQKARMWTKGQDKSKIEMLSPMKQTTITNGDKMAISNPETGQKMVQDLKKIKDQGIKGARDQGQMNLEKAKEFFDFSVRKLEALKPGDLETYIVTGVPKKENKFLGKMEFFIDSDKWAPVRIVMLDAKGKQINETKIEYAQMSGVWVPVKSQSVVNTPMGKMDVEMDYNNVRVNQGIKDSEFKVE
ncbi:outer membrane lipoprotein-sorting protein [Candidatus Saganbacteria bacterium]|nr:outer membrane lipoprotein-sorting protein [Candidatus Saganbacteria bacterium]